MSGLTNLLPVGKNPHRLHPLLCGWLLMFSQEITSITGIDDFDESHAIAVLSHQFLMLVELNVHNTY